MNDEELNRIEREFYSFLDKLSGVDLKKFLLCYARLLLLFPDELGPQYLKIVLEREKQLRGERFSGDAFDNARKSLRECINLELRGNVHLTRPAETTRLLFCLMLDTSETDIYYLIEPIFEFARRRRLSPKLLAQVIWSEFDGSDPAGG